MSGVGVVIRQMCSGDLERVLEIAASLRHSPHWPRSAYLSALDPQAEPRRVALIAADSENNCVIGFAIASLVLPVAELETIAVAEEHQRRRVGLTLLNRLVDELRRQGVNEIVLEVRASNGAGIGLYRRCGFVENGCRKGYYAEPVEDATVMRLTMG
jgi:[ribosomal protein S18]-alanine N-acetyltransferase